jgi:uncharacterized flavoprotein (TIGR03862 family)
VSNDCLIISSKKIFLTAPPKHYRAIVIGAGPAGLMAAEVLANDGVQVDVFDAMPSVGRKFLLAGRGGLNLTHAEDSAVFVTRYAERQAELTHLLECFGADHLRAWVHGLGVETFVGSSQRVFPKEMKAAPLLRAWLHRLRASGVRFHVRKRWLGWADDGSLRFASLADGGGEEVVTSDVCILALGGASWQRLGSDGAWAPLLQAKSVEIAPLRPANCGFHVKDGWTDHLRHRFAGQPLKPVALKFRDSLSHEFSRQGEFVITDTGIEGSLVYAASALLREEILLKGSATLTLDLLPDKTLSQVERAVVAPRGSRSLSNHLRSRLGLQGLKVALLYELLDHFVLADPLQLAKVLKALPLTLVSTRPIDEAISTAGGVRFEALNEHAMLKALPGVFCAGEMLDWEAPTGGYLLTGCFASGRAAGFGALAWLESP